MPDTILYNSQTKQQVARFLASPSHALLLVGPIGSGKTFLSTAIACGLLEQNFDTVFSYPYFTIIQPEKSGGSISIETIRQLQHRVRLKTVGERAIRRVFIIERAEKLTIEAQNALLKLLEEPPLDTVLILTTPAKRLLLPTITSRVQSISVYAPSDEELQEHFSKQNKSNSEISQAFFLSGGLPGLMHALLEEDTTHPLTAGVATAKQLLGQQTFERLTLVDTLSKNKDEAAYTLDALQHIAETGIQQATQKRDSARIKQWHRVLKTTVAAAEALSQNANPKLVLTNLMLSL